MNFYGIMLSDISQIKMNIISYISYVIFQKISRMNSYVFSAYSVPVMKMSPLKWKTIILSKFT